jgi:adenylate kinase family enzyme
VDPVLVIRIKRTGWVVVDGHHSIAAYKKLGRGEQEVTCDWFQGTVREALDESLARNIKIKLNLPKHDKHEEAWKRTLLNHGSKSDVVKKCVVSDGAVATMRRVKRTAMGVAADLDPEDVKRCRERLRIQPAATAEEALEALKERSWSMTRLALVNLLG